MTERRVVTKPLDWFTFDNKRQKFDRDALILLGKSLRRRQWHPVIARSDGTVVDGERRVRAGKLEGLATLDTIIIDELMTQTELRLAQGQTAMHRAGLTAAEEYGLCTELLGLNTDWGLKELAEHLGIDPAVVTKIMSASKTIPEVRDALTAGKLTRSDVYAISKAPEAEQAALLQAKLTGSITSREGLERKVRERKNFTANGRQRPTRMKAILPSGAEVVVTATALDISGLIDALSELLKLAHKAEKNRIDVRTFEAILRDQAKGVA